MTNAFISYAREDVEFVRALHDQLGAHERTTWVDWEGIPPSIEFLEEIYGAIDQADSFLFVISPDSVDSEICQQELAHALKHHKRIIPIVRREVAADAMPAALAKRSWIFWRESGEAGGALGDVLCALDLDIEWVRAHTRLLVRAQEWARNDQNASFTLRGRALEEAEQLLARTHDQDPILTPHQTEFILASRRAARRRQRIVVGSVTCGLVVAIALAILSFSLYRVSETQRRGLLAQTLGGRSELLLDQQAAQLKTSALLAAEAMKRAPSRKADRVIRKVLAVLSRTVAEIETEQEAAVQAFSSNSLYLVRGFRDGRVVVWETPTLKTVFEGEQETPVTAVASDASGRMQATGGSDAIYVWSLDGRTPSRRLAQNATVKALTLDPQGKYLAAVTEDGKTQILSVEDFSVMHTLVNEKANRPLMQCLFTPNGRGLFVWGYGTGAKWTEVWDATNGRLVQALNHDRRAAGHGWAFSPISLSMAWCSPSTALVQILDGGLQIEHEFGNQVSVDFSPVDRLFVAGSRGHYAVVKELASGRNLAMLRHDASVWGAIFSHDGSLVCTRSGDGLLRVWDWDDQQEVGRIVHGEFLPSYRFTPDDKAIVVCGKTRLRVWEVRGYGEDHVIEHAGKLVSLSMTSDNNLVAVGEIARGEMDGRILVYDAIGETRGELRAELPIPGMSPRVRFDSGSQRLLCWDPVSVWLRESASEESEWIKLDHSGVSDFVSDFGFVPGGNRIFSAAGSVLRLWGDSPPREENVLEFSEQIKGVAPDPTGALVAASFEDETIRLIRLSNQETYRSIDAGMIADRIIWTREGKLIAAARNKNAGINNPTGVLRIWDLPSGEQRSSLTIKAVIKTVEVSPSGRFVVIACDDETVRVLSTDDTREIAVIPQGDIEIMEAAFSPDERYIVSCGYDGRLKYWKWRPEDLIREVGSRISRNLTRDEWEQYMVGEPYAETFPRANRD